MKTLKHIFDTADFDNIPKESMDKVNCIMDSFVEEVRIAHPEKVESMLFKVSMLLSGEYMSKELAEHLTSKFNNKDGTKGAHWDYETTTSVKPEEIESCADWHYMLNKVYCKLYQAEKTTEHYIEDAKDTLMMLDGKAKKYIQAMYL